MRRLPAPEVSLTRRARVGRSSSCVAVVDHRGLQVATSEDAVGCISTDRSQTAQLARSANTADPGLARGYRARSRTSDVVALAARGGQPSDATSVRPPAARYSLPRYWACPHSGGWTDLLGLQKAHSWRLHYQRAGYGRRRNKARTPWRSSDAGVVRLSREVVRSELAVS